MLMIWRAHFPAQISQDALWQITLLQLHFGKHGGKRIRLQRNRTRAKYILDNVRTIYTICSARDRVTLIRPLVNVERTLPGTTRGGKTIRFLESNHVRRDFSES